MLSGQNIICIGVTDFGTDIPTGKDQIMKILSQQNRILMVNTAGNRTPKLIKRDFQKAFGKITEWFRGVRRFSNNIFIFSPIRMPFSKYPIIRKLNLAISLISLNLIVKKLGFDKPILWIYNLEYADICQKLDHSLTIYYVCDDYSLFRGVPQRILQEKEQQLLRSADLVFVAHRPLYEDRKKLNSNTCLIPNATNPEHFQINFNLSITDDIANLKHPIVGFSGTLDDDWVDIDLIYESAITYPSYSFVLLGTVKADWKKLQELSNVYYLGRKSYNRVPLYYQAFDICIIPFKQTPLTKNIDIPLKLLEYFAVGKPVVAININKLEEFEGIYWVAESREQFIQYLGMVLDGETESLKMKRMEIARQNSWMARVNQMSEIIEELEKERLSK